MDPFIEVITAPLETVSFLPGHALPWYSSVVLDRTIGKCRFDMVIVDGPAAYHRDIELARLPAAYYVKKRLADDFSIFLHDTDRAGEQHIVRVWDELLGIKGKAFVPKLYGYLTNQRFNISM
jgi:hypothetical protein